MLTYRYTTFNLNIVSSTSTFISEMKNPFLFFRQHSLKAYLSQNNKKKCKGNELAKRYFLKNSIELYLGLVPKCWCKKQLQAKIQLNRKKCTSLCVDYVGYASVVFNFYLEVGYHDVCHECHFKFIKQILCCYNKNNTTHRNFIYFFRFHIPCVGMWH